MRRRGDRIPGRRGYGGVLLVPCLLHAAYRYWFLADTGAARTLITPDVALDLGLDLRPPVRQVRIASVHQVVSAPLVHLVSLQGRSVLICFADDGVIGCAMEADA